MKFAVLIAALLLAALPAQVKARLNRGAWPQLPGCFECAACI